MKTKCCLLAVDDDMQAAGTNAILQFVEPMRGIPGKVCPGLK